MYKCSICKNDVLLVEGVKPTCCVGAKIVTDMEGTAHGVGALNEVEVPKLDTNLSDTSIVVVRAMMIGVSAVEFMGVDNKKEIFAKDLTIADESTGRKFSFTITAKEV